VNTEQKLILLISKEKTNKLIDIIKNNDDLLLFVLEKFTLKDSEIRKILWSMLERNSRKDVKDYLFSIKTSSQINHIFIKEFN